MDNQKIYTVNEIREIIKQHQDFFEQNFEVDKFLLFGSYAKNLQTAQSDIDLLVHFKKPIDMFKFMDLEEYLSNLFNKKIDLGTPTSLKKIIKDKILKEAVAL